MDGDSAIPPYAWIAWQLRDAIRAGVRGLGESMPSESELAEQYGVSRMTAGKVLGLLAEPHRTRQTDCGALASPAHSRGSSDTHRLGAIHPDCAIIRDPRSQLALWHNAV